MLLMAHTFLDCMARIQGEYDFSNVHDDNFCCALSAYKTVDHFGLLQTCWKDESGTLRCIILHLYITVTPKRFALVLDLNVGRLSLTALLVFP